MVAAGAKVLSAEYGSLALLHVGARTIALLLITFYVNERVQAL